MIRVWVATRGRFRAEEGAGIIEYSLLVVLIAIVALLAVTTVGQEVSSSLDNSASNIADAM
jgi:Flp pilus assembly pilin Flp